MDRPNPNEPIPPLLLAKPSIYTHSDPLLKRLRLEDAQGQPIENIRREFERKQVVVFFIGSVEGSETLKELNIDLVDLARREASCAVIYVSVDTTQSSLDAVTRNKPFYRMSLLDNSDFAVMATKENLEEKKRAVLEEVLRDEEFITGEEIEIGGLKVELGSEVEEDGYLRPLSRAAVCQLTHSYATPSLAVYHIPSHRFLSKNAPRAQFRPHRVDANYREWKNGGRRGTTFADVWDAGRIPIVILLMGLIYNAFRYFGGEEYNVIPQVLDALRLKRLQS